MDVSPKVSCSVYYSADVGNENEAARVDAGTLKSRFSILFLFIDFLFCILYIVNTDLAVAPLSLASPGIFAL